MRIESADLAARYAGASGRPESAAETEPDGDADDRAAVSAAKARLEQISPVPPETGTKVNLLA